MKAERRKKVVSISDAETGAGGFGGWFAKHGNTVLTGLLIAAAVALLVRWRLNVAKVARDNLDNELNEARALVDQLLTPDTRGSSADLIKTLQTVEVDANSKLSDVINTSDDAAVRAQAWVVRGDLYWQLANFPALPGAENEPTLRLKKTSAELLQQSADAYNSVLNTPEYATAHDAVQSARLGLAAIAENRGDWVNATKLLNAVKSDPAAGGEKVEAASIQLELISDPNNSIQDPVYLAPATPATPTSLPSVPIPMGPFKPATLPATPVTVPMVPATLPTTRPK